MKTSSLSLLYLTWLNLIVAHSNMFMPKPRGNLQWWGYCSRGNGCSTACDAPKASSPFNSPFNEKKVVKRGEEISVEWLRQNHPGGFVRLAIVPMDQSDDHNKFDQNVLKYTCYETNCKEDFHEPILGKLNGPGSALCTTKLKIPNNLKDGPITLQWTWFGGGVLFADQNAAFANYISCSDMLLQGGEPYQPTSNKPEFIGGDVAYKGSDKCRYWASNSIFGCPLGAEDSNKQGCGYGPAKFGAPEEWLKVNGAPTENSKDQSSTITSSTKSDSIPTTPTSKVEATQSIPDKVPTTTEIKHSESSSNKPMKTFDTTLTGTSNPPIKTKCYSKV